MKKQKNPPAQRAGGLCPNEKMKGLLVSVRSPCFVNRPCPVIDNHSIIALAANQRPLVGGLVKTNYHAPLAKARASVATIVNVPCVVAIKFTVRVDGVGTTPFPISHLGIDPI